MGRILPPTVEAGAPLGQHTTYGIGGKADLGRPEELGQLVELLAWCRAEGRAYRVLGRGSNVLVPDEGLGELVILLGRGFETAERTPGGYRAGAAHSLPKLAIETARKGLSGLEHFVGIPGSVGGAVTMNAGCLGAEIRSAVRRVRVLTPEGEEGWLDESEMGFAYRRSRLQRADGLGPEVCVEAELALGEEEPARLMEVVRDENKRRQQTQPYKTPNAGSVFKNPPGDYAGRLVESTGLKGLRIGGAEVSTLHANFIVNPGGATAEDVVRVMAEVHNRVLEAQGIDLELEIQLWAGLQNRYAELTAG
jgi:UDP-N-acetylmuramate dehydrogenase